MIIGVTILIGEATAVIREGDATMTVVQGALAVYPHVAREKAVMIVACNQTLGWVILVQGKG
jgi:hypothetical protein